MSAPIAQDSPTLLAAETFLVAWNTLAMLPFCWAHAVLVQGRI